MQDFCCFVFVFNLPSLYQIYLHLSNNSHLQVDLCCHLCFLPWNRGCKGQSSNVGVPLAVPPSPPKSTCASLAPPGRGPSHSWVCQTATALALASSHFLGKTCAFSKLQIFLGRLSGVIYIRQGWNWLWLSNGYNENRPQTDKRAMMLYALTTVVCRSWTETVAGASLVVQWLRFRAIERQARLALDPWSWNWIPPATTKIEDPGSHN